MSGFHTKKRRLQFIEDADEGIVLPDIAPDFAWIPYENAEGYADSAEVTSSAFRVGGRTLTNPGGATAPTWDATEKAILFNAAGGTDQYLVDNGSASLGIYNKFHVANASASCWWVVKAVVDTTLQTLLSTARLATETGIRHFTDDSTGVGDLGFDDSRVDLYATGDETENVTSGIGGSTASYFVFGFSYDAALGVPNFQHIRDENYTGAGLTTFSGTASNHTYDATFGALTNGNDNGLSAFVRAVFIKWDDHTNYATNTAEIVSWASGL